MTAYNSRKVNRDPYPYTTNGEWGGKPLRSDKPYFQGSHDPRPEFDNNPNPLLTAFRWVQGENPEDTENPIEWLESVLAHDWVESELDADHIDHARKVLGRLANV